MIGIVTGMVEEADQIFGGHGRAEADRNFYHRPAKDGVHIACFGIGKVNAAMAASFLLTQGCTLLLSGGVAGRLSNRSGDVFWIREAVQHDFGALRPEGLARFRAGSLPFGRPSLRAFTAMDDPGMGLPQARIATGDVFVECRDQSLQLADATDADLVDMETAAIAQVADRMGMPWGAIRAISDEADDSGVTNFQKNVARAAANAARQIERLVRILG